MRNKQAILLILSMLLATFAHSTTVTIPAGTKIFVELEQQVTSDVKDFDVGDIVQGRAWRNVVVDGQTVVAAGAPMLLRISDIKKRRIAGRGGDVTIQAVSVTAVDGTEIFLDGGYDREAGNQTGLSASLSALVFWPAIFIRGKHAVLEPGTVFDASIPANTNISVPEDRPRTLRLASVSDLTVEVLYDELEENADALPLRLTLCHQEWVEPVGVTAVNERSIETIPVEMAALEQIGDCHVGSGGVELKALRDYFVRGINRFTVTVGPESEEVLLDVEM